MIAFGQQSLRSETLSSLYPTRVILDQDTGAFLTWEQEQRIMEKIIYKNIYKDDLKAAISLYVEESNKHENTRSMLELQRNQTSRLEADLKMTNNRLAHASTLKEIAESKYLKEEKRKRRWRRAATAGPLVIGVGGFILGAFLAQ